MESNALEVVPSCLDTIGRVDWGALLEILECPVCREYMTEPIRQCVRGHSFCGDCYELLTSCPVCRSPRCLWSSEMTQWLPEFVSIPCRYKDKGCTAVRRGGRIRYHEIFCRYHTRKCPRNLGRDCQWEGCFKDLLEHCVDSHPGAALGKQEKIICHKITELRHASSNILFVIICTERKLFRLALMYSQENDVVKWSCSYYGPFKNARNYSYEVKFQVSDQTSVAFTRSCAPFYEDDSGFNCRYGFRTPLDELLRYCDAEGDLIFFLEIHSVRIFSRQVLGKGDDSPVLRTSNTS